MKTQHSHQTWLQAASFLVVLTLVGIAAVYFGTGFAALLILLASITYMHTGIGLGLLLLVVSADSTHPVWGGIYVSFSEMEAGVVASAWLARWLRSPAGDRTRLVWKPLVWSAPYLAVVLLSGLINEPWYKAVLHLVRNSEPFILLFVSVQVFQTEVRRRRLSLAIGAAAVVYSGLGFWSLIVNNGPTLHRLSSTFSNPNQFSAYLNLLLPFILVFYLLEQRRPRRVIWGALGLAVATTLLLTGSRSGVVAALAMGGVLAWVRRKCVKVRPEPGPPPLDTVQTSFNRTPRLLLLCMAAILALSGSIYWLVNPVSLERQMRNWTPQRQSESLQSSLVVRYRLVRIGYLIWSEKPLMGVGPGNYAQALAEHKEFLKEAVRPEIERTVNERVGNLRRRPALIQRGLERSWEMSQTHAHSLPLQVAVEFGLLGLLTFLFFGMKLLLHFGNRACRSPWSLAGLLVLVGILVHNMADVTFPSLGLEIALLIGLSWAEAGDYFCDST